MLNSEKWWPTKEAKKDPYPVFRTRVLPTRWTALDNRALEDGMLKICFKMSVEAITLILSPYSTKPDKKGLHVSY